MDKNEKLWFSTKNSASNHNILWSGDFEDTRYCGQKVNKMRLLFEDKNIDTLYKILEMREDWVHA